MHAASDEGINPCEVYLVEIPEAAWIFLRSFDQEAIICLRLRCLRCRSSRDHATIALNYINFSDEERLRSRPRVLIIRQANSSRLKAVRNDNGKKQIPQL